MHTLQSLTFELYTDRHGRDMISIQGRRSDDSPGLRYISFYMTRLEFESVVTGQASSVNDLGHNLRALGDHWTFYDLDFPSRSAGEMRVPYIVLTMPGTTMRAVLRLARKTWRLQREAMLCDGCRTRVSVGDIPVRECRACPDSYYVPRVRLEMSKVHRERSARLYGQGKGSVRWEMDERAATRLAEVKEAAASASESTDRVPFAESLERIECIARNSTRGFHQCAVVKFSRDSDGFYWQAHAPNGHRIMNGGLINHAARDNGHDWSIHT